MSDEEMVDPILVCIYCGDLMDYPTENQLRIFGGNMPDCCGLKMLTVERNKLWEIAKGMENLKKKIEEEMLRGIA